MKSGLLLLFLFISLAARGQTLSYQTLTTEDGLPNNDIYYAMQDTKGYIWFGTKNGVSRWDSKNFKNFTVDDGLPNNEAIYIYEDSLHRIWFSTLSKKLCYYYQGKIHNSDTDPFLNKIDIYPGSKIIEANGELYYCLPKGKLCKYNFIRNENQLLKASFEHAYYFLNYQNKIWAIDCFNKGNNLISSEIDSFRSSASILPNFPDAALITKIDYPSKKYYFQHGLDSPFYASDFGGDHFKGALYNDGNIVELYDGKIVFIKTGRQICIKNKNMPQLYCHSGNLAVFDHDNMWVNNQRVLQEFKLPDIHDHAFSYLFVYKNKVYGINKTFEAIDLASGKAVNQINEIVKCAYNGIPYRDHYMLTTAWKLYDWQGAAFRALDLNDKEVGNYKQLSVSKLPGYFFSANGSCGIYRLNFDEKKYKNIYRDSTTSIYAVFEDHSFRLWCASLNHIFFAKDYTDTIRNPQNFVLDSSRPVFCSDISEDRDGNMLFTTHSGLFLFDGKIKYRIDKTNLLTDNICNKALINPGDSSIWIATNNGLNHIRYYRDRGRLRFRVINRFFETDGLFSNTVNDILLHEGKLYIATNKGINLLDDLNYRPGAQKIPVYVHLGTINGTQQKQTDIQNNIQLEYDQNNLSLHFSALYFIRRARLMVSARLYRNEQLISVNDITEDKIDYYSLNDGRYKLVLYVYDQDYTYINGSSAPFYFTIHPPYYKTAWFIAGSCFLFTILSTGLLFWRFNKRKNRQLKEEQLNTALNISHLKSLQNQMNPHFVYNSLNTVQYFITNKDEKSALDYLSDFSALIRDMLEQSSNTLIAIEDEIGFLKKYISLEMVRFDNSFEVIWDIQLEENDLSDIYIPTMLVQPVLENAVRHGVSQLTGIRGRIVVAISLKNEHLLGITIQNNGSAAKTGAGHSIAVKTIKDRLKVYTKNGIHGEYHLSVTETGATAIITIPI